MEVKSLGVKRVHIISSQSTQLAALEKKGS